MVTEFKEFEIWGEGFSCTGNSSEAQFIGKSFGKNFMDACVNFEYPEDVVRKADGVIITKKGDKLSLDKHYSYPSIWGCRLFDNESDARKLCG